MNVTPFIAEVIETGPLTYSEGPKSKAGIPLPVGSIRVRPINNSTKTSLKLLYARPMTLSLGIPPLNGEHVLVFPGPSLDESEGGNVAASYYYFPFALNATDDAVINQMPDANFRVPPSRGGGLTSLLGPIITGGIGNLVAGLLGNFAFKTPERQLIPVLEGGNGHTDINIDEKPIVKAQMPNLPVSPGRTFPRPARPIRVLQWYEGDFIMQNKGGASLRLGIGTSVNGQYSAQPEYHATPPKGSPMFSLVCDEPNGPMLRPLAEIPKAISNAVNFPPFKKASQKFRTESLARIKTGIYGGIQLQLQKIIPARNCYNVPKVMQGLLPFFGPIKDIKKYKGPQIALDTDRVVFNAKRDCGFFLARKKIIIEASKIYLITNKHLIDVDELVEEVEKLTQELVRLTAGQYPFLTPVGPTGPSPLGLIAFLRRLAAQRGFHHICFTPPSPPGQPSPPAVFGINTVSGPSGNKRIIGMGGGIEGDGPGTTGIGQGGNGFGSNNTGGGSNAGGVGSGPSDNTGIPPTDSSGIGGTGPDGVNPADPSDSNSNSANFGSGSPNSGVGDSSSGPSPKDPNSGTGIGGPNTGTGPGTGTGNNGGTNSTSGGTSPTGGGTSPAGGGGGGGTGGSNNDPLQNCEYTIELFDSARNGWQNCFVVVKVNGALVSNITVEQYNTTRTIKTKRGDILEVAYTGTDPNFIQNSFMIAMEGKIVYASPQPIFEGLHFKDTCKTNTGTPEIITDINTGTPIINQGGVSTSPGNLNTFKNRPDNTIINLEPELSGVLPVYIYDFYTTEVSATDQSEAPRQYKLALIVQGNPGVKGWHLVPSSPVAFIPSRVSLLSSDTLADLDCLTKELQNRFCLGGSRLLGSKLKKLPYSISLKK